jgi:hypothetical protein
MNALIVFLVVAVLFFAWLYNREKGRALDKKIELQRKEYEARWGEHAKKMASLELHRQETRDEYGRKKEAFLDLSRASRSHIHDGPDDGSSNGGV